MELGLEHRRRLVVAARAARVAALQHRRRVGHLLPLPAADHLGHVVARGEQRERAQLLGRALVREPLPDLRRDDVRVDRLLEATGEGEGEG